MFTSTSNRRSFIKKMARLSAITAAAAMFPGILFADEQEEGLLKETLIGKKVLAAFVV